MNRVKIKYIEHYVSIFIQLTYTLYVFIIYIYRWLLCLFEIQLLTMYINEGQWWLAVKVLSY